MMTEHIYDSIVEAAKVVDDPKLVDECPLKYWVVRDVGGKNLQKAINVFVKRGWECTQLTADAGTLYVLMEK